MTDAIKEIHVNLYYLWVDISNCGFGLSLSVYELTPRNEQYSDISIVVRIGMPAMKAEHETNEVINEFKKYTPQAALLL